MCELTGGRTARQGMKTVTLEKAVGTVLAHDITEIRPGEFKGPAFRKGQVIREQDICHLRRLGKENLFVLEIGDDELHEDDAAYVLARALMGEGVAMKGGPREGKIDIVAERDGLLQVDRDALLRFNMHGEVMCATLHRDTVVRKGQVVAGTRAIPLVVKRKVVDETIGALQGAPVIGVRQMRRPKAGVVITGNEVYYGRIQDAFGPVIKEKIEAVGGRILGLYYAPDDEAVIEARLKELVNAGADLLITTGGMSVDPDDVTRFAIRRLGATDIVYGSAVLPGAMFLIAYLDRSHQVSVGSDQGEENNDQPLTTHHSPLTTVLGIPACGMYARTTVFDLVLPRILAGERIGRRELAELGHGGLCMRCPECRYPACPFGKA